mmetsp:Transcript_51090/g.121385  ORF Transcript_51090/g.121385 Transcript_51090/m.121385 type:complete len:523 (+) Transcript_51090:99-1667(+)
MLRASQVCRQSAAAAAKAVVVGGGPVGAAMAVVCRNAGMEVDVFEKYSDLRLRPLNARRSINLTLGRRGVRLADSLGRRDQLLGNTVPVRGRMIHDLDGSQHFQPYGVKEECNFSIDRGELNAFWLSLAAEAGARLHFDHMLEDFDLEQGHATFIQTQSPEGMSVDRNLNLDVSVLQDGRSTQVTGIDLFLACDGAGSFVRRALVDRYADISQTSDFIGWGYKEVTFPALPGGKPVFDNDEALHIWPRGDHFLMALPNPGGSFTGTIYMDDTAPRPDGVTPKLSGGASFQSTSTVEGARALWEECYPDALACVGEAGLRQHRENPVGLLGTVRTSKYFVTGARTNALLAGDSAHAIVPFFGQGVQAGLEDAFELRELLGGLSGLGSGSSRHAVFSRLAEEFSRLRVRNNEALREMALENAVEMGDKVGQERFRLRKALEKRLEEEIPHKYRSRYALVSYSHNPYADVFELGKVQSIFLEELVDHMLQEKTSDVAQLDRNFLEAEVDRVITPTAQSLGVRMSA